MTCWYLRKKEEVRRAVEAVPPRLWLSMISVPTLALSLFAFAHPLDIFLVTDEHGSKDMVIGYGLEPHSVAAEVGYDMEGVETILHTEGTPQTLDLVTVDYAFAVDITADGESSTVYTHEMSVQDLLSEYDIELTGDDFTEPAAETMLMAESAIELFRVTYEQEAITDVIEHETINRYSSLMNRRADRPAILVEGMDGEGTLTYEHKYINGERVETTLIDEELVAQPIAEVILNYGTEPVSPLTEGFENYPIVDGVPTNYKSVIVNGIATGYYSARGMGSSGIGLFYGSCAVNPNVIPYGSKLYIASSEGDSFVYGYAIATDTGTALMEGIIDVDLFYETYTESAINGKRIVNIYILE